MTPEEHYQRSLARLTQRRSVFVLPLNSPKYSVRTRNFLSAIAIMLCQSFRTIAKLIMIMKNDNDKDGDGDAGYGYDNCNDTRNNNDNDDDDDDDSNDDDPDLMTMMMMLMIKQGLCPEQ